ncbi:hypothetical protein DWB61_14940 [Ancylomarina euxinus]|uniref:GLPGLI family protein n=1 Tax=Ancylomarina euxinus TaxID=2283627 RepID=A0A425XXQ7_9BACT|nr:hypothetical protein [Ancylomarina euxinus]MCZ4696012.1 hypothetical protein [Ancylomarina euxinus]MUP13951.1 hypothetical protein [Ancylomarina euxinus]RRG19507.1 hypothetical protein DWB61_14940 [Ancylomarina euxinus]
MNTKKNLIILLFLLIGSATFAQKHEATLFLKEGTKLKGLARIKADHTVKFRKDKNSEACIYTFREIRGLKIEEDYEQNTYHYKMIKKNMVMRPKLFKLCVKGKMSLYSLHHKYMHTVGGSGPITMAGPPGVGSVSMPGFPGHTMGGETTSYYICMNDNHIVEPVTKVGNGLGRSLRKTGLKFFKDCPVVAEKIRNKTYKKRDIELAVYEYNLHIGN